MPKLKYCDHLQDADDSHPSQALIDYYPHDTELRGLGWVIYARPRTGPAIWAFGNIGGPRATEMEAWLLGKRKKGTP